MGWGHSTDPGHRLGGTGTGYGTGQHDDQMFAEAAHQSSSGLAIEVTVRRKTGMAAGSPSAGLQRHPTFANIGIRCYLFQITAADVYRSGGFYQHGDIVLGLEEFAVRLLAGEIRGSQSESDTEGDRVLFPHQPRDPSVPIEYRVVGQVDFHPIGGTQIVRQILCRKLSRAS